MDSLTPSTEKRPNNLPKRVNIPAKASSPLQQELQINKTPIFKIRPKDHNSWFYGKEMEILIKRVENIVEIEEESGRYIEIQIYFLTKDQDIRYHIEGITGYLTGDWEKSELDMKKR
ncbi:hypothetical protein O181_071109 [Austropuccinia psidii MF-1]|uniref:Uncharacterized protein n=1 Tax=Austropuccinia psidii MF-1 TaxID=1389203 RepID=A0A9Q3F2L1_9BASI|nr:hypothetical protein [Austropuccinia psidii MF-1]